MTVRQKFWKETVKPNSSACECAMFKTTEPSGERYTSSLYY